MKNDLLSIIQKCTCVDFLLNSLINSNSYNYLTFLSDVKEENLRNIKILCYLYEYISKDVLPIENIDSVNFDKSSPDNLNTLLEIILNILSELETLKKYITHEYCYQVLTGLINSYFDFTSSIHCINPVSSNYDKVQFSIFNNLDEKNIKLKKDKEIDSDTLRSISINAINYFFDYNLNDETINDEYYEIFFENNLSNKFYQYSFKSNNSFFKLKIFSKDGTLFYMYQKLLSLKDLNLNLSKKEAIIFSQNYLKGKFKDKFYSFSIDKNYAIVSSDKDNIIKYKLRYNINNQYTKSTIFNSIYLTVNAKYMIVEEIYII